MYYYLEGKGKQSTLQAAARASGMNLAAACAAKLQSLLTQRKIRPAINSLKHRMLLIMLQIGCGGGRG